MCAHLTVSIPPVTSHIWPCRGTLCPFYHSQLRRSAGPSRNADVATRVANHPPKGQNRRVFEPGQTVRVNLSGLRVKDVTFQSAVTDAVGNIIRQTSQEPPMYLVRLLFSFRGVNEVEVPPERIKAAA